MNSDCKHLTRSYYSSSDSMGSIEVAVEAAGTARMKVRHMKADDALALAESCYYSFLEFNQSVSIPPHLDFASIESTREILKHMSSAPGTFGVVVEEESSGSIMAAGLMTPGEVYGIGPIWADNAFKGRGAAKAVTVALVEKAKSEDAKSIRFNQVLHNISQRVQALHGKPS